MQVYQKILNDLNEVNRRTSLRSGNYRASFGEDRVSIQHDDGGITFCPVGSTRRYISIPIEDARELASFILYMTEEV